jgi:hypothetical protein
MKNHLKQILTICSVCCLFATSTAYAQLDVQNFANSIQSFLTDDASKNGKTTYSSLGDYTGSPFLFKDFKRAVVYTAVGQKKGVEFFNFDTYSNRYVLSEENGISAQNFIWLDDKQVEKIAVQDDDQIRVFVVETIFKSSGNSGIVEQLYSNGDDIRIVIQHEAVYNKPNQTNTGYATSGSKARFRAKDKTYALIGTNEPLQLKKDKDLVTLFGDKEKAAMKWIKKNKIDWEKPSDLNKLFAEFSVTAK